MKLRITHKTALAVAVITFAFILSTCTPNWFYDEIPLRLTSVKIGDFETTGIPVPIEAEDWDNEEYLVGEAAPEFVIVKPTGMENKYITAKANRNATVTYGLAKGGVRPARFDDLRKPVTFDLSDSFFFKVSDPIKGESVYFRFDPREASPVKELAALAIAGREPDKVPPPAGVSMDDLKGRIASATYRGELNITRGEALGTLVAATPQDATARIKYALAANLNDARSGLFSDFEDAEVVVIQDEQNKNITQGHDTMTFTDGNILAVEVTAQDDTKYYYGFRVFSGRMATIKTLKFDSKVVAGKGTESPIWTNVLPGSFASADQDDITGFNVKIELEDSEGTAELGVITSGSSQPPYTPGLNLTRVFSDKNVLAVKVHSPRDDPNDIRFYKVQVNLLAANFKRHPKSAAYTIKSHTYQPANAPGENYHGRILITTTGDRVLDREIEELSFELDRELPGATYQWYTANSWYGGYGFDREGRIGGDPGTLDSEGNALTRDDYHPSTGALDEKANISNHNGGNTWYRLPYPAFDSVNDPGYINEEDTPIPLNNPNGNRIIGANSPTYTPTITAKNRPFISPGFTNQTQYYWVIVTSASGLKVESYRAAIVTEWGMEFQQGRPLTEKAVTKKHHIVDLHAWMDPSSKVYGLKGKPRNDVPFKAGNHGDMYLIPITFPPDFNIMDYSIVTCWANFYLADGRPWIQNWTNGDFGFADADGNKIVLWYNVTNDNATRGLGSSGNEPAGGGLNVKPAYLVVQPAGTTPINQMPPFSGKDSYGRDKPDYAKIKADGKTAQGWFTPYIEITELRFEGPAR